MDLLRQLSEYQNIQRKHDIEYHADIVSMSELDRMKHISLHFQKYSYPLMNCEKTEAFTKAFVDTFIMAISASTILDLKELKIETDHDEDFFKAFIKNTSLFAKACESQDHKELFPYKAAWIESTRNLIDLSLHKSKKMKIEIFLLARERLSYVELTIDQKRVGS